MGSGARSAGGSQVRPAAAGAAGTGTPAASDTSDYGEINEFYAEYVADAKEADGGLEVALIDVWRGVWKGHFSDVKIREIKAVSGKNVKRAELRRLLRRTVTPARIERVTIKCVRQLFRDSLRRERGFYWEIRLLSGRYPEGYTTAITDGAT